MNKKPKRPLKNHRRWLSLVSIPFQMLITIGLGYYAGNWVDERYHIVEKYGALIGTLVGVGLSLYHTISMLNRINKK